MFVVVAVLIARRFSVSRVYLLLFLPHLRLVRLAAVVVAVLLLFFWTLSLNLHTYLRRHSHTHLHIHMHILHAFFIFILSLIGIAVFVPSFLLLFNPFLDNAWQQKQKELTVIVSTTTITTKTVRGGVLARAPTLSKRAQTQRRQRRRSALLEVVCFSHLFHTHTRAHAAATRSHTHTRIRIRKRDWKCVCVILLLGQLEATFLGNCQLPQYFNYGLSACVCAHNSIC